MNLTLLVGLSGSGKSFTAHQLADDNTIVISSDVIRKELYNDETDQTHNGKVFETVHKRMKAALLAEQNVIIDATNLTIKARKGILSNIPKGLNVCKTALVLNTPLNQCVSHDLARPRTVGAAVIFAQEQRFQIPVYSEGFDNIVLTNELNTLPAGYSLTELRTLMQDFDQHGEYHIQSLGEHCETASHKFAVLYPEYELAAYLHDIGKLFTRTQDKNGNYHFYGHNSVGAYYLLTSYIPGIKYNADWINAVVPFVNYHDLYLSPSSKTLTSLSPQLKKMIMDFADCDIEPFLQPIAGHLCTK